MARLLPALFLALFVLSACDSAGPEPAPEPLDVRTAEDVPADPTTGRDPNTGRPTSTGLFTLYDLDAGKVVLSSAETDPAARARDSASTVWDLGLKGTTLIVNGGTSGPGQGAAQILTEAFADVVEAPASGYATDGENTCPAVETPGGSFPGAPYAICTGSDNGWYTYTGGIVTPLPGRTIVLRTGEGDYAKLRIRSYYQGNPAAPTTDSVGRYYTFEYVLQPDGSRRFDTTPAD